MNDLTTLEALYLDKPTEGSLRAMLIDCLMEEAGLTRFAAELRAEITHVAGVQAIEVAQAAAHLAPRSIYRGELRVWLRWCVGVPRGTAYTVVVVPAEQLSSLSSLRRGAVDGFWPRVTITVGARRVLRRVEGIKVERANNLIPEYGYRWHRG